MTLEERKQSLSIKTIELRKLIRLSPCDKKETNIFEKNVNLKSKNFKQVTKKAKSKTSQKVCNAYPI